MDRRAFIRTTAIAASAAGAGAGAAEPAAPPAPAPEATRILARHVAAARFEDLPETVRVEAGRSLLNWTGVAVGGSRHETIEIALAAIAPFAGPPQACVWSAWTRSARRF